MMQGDTLWATPNHPFWYRDIYIEAGKLKSGDTLTSKEGHSSVIKEILYIPGDERVYNFTVEGNNNYYVGREGFLVHNDCFLDRIEDAPALIAKIDELPKGLKGEFLKDFYNAGEDVLGAFKANPNLVKAWEVAAKHNDALRLDIGFLTNLSHHIDNYPKLDLDIDNPVLFNAYKKIHDNPELGFELNS